MGNCTSNNKELPIATKIEESNNDKIDDKDKDKIDDKDKIEYDETILNYLIKNIVLGHKNIVYDFIKQLYDNNYNKSLFNDKTTILIEVCKKGWEEIAVLLLKKPELCNINFHDEDDRSALHLCSINHNMEDIVNILLKNDAKVTFNITCNMIISGKVSILNDILSNPSEELIISIKNNTLLLTYCIDFFFMRFIEYDYIKRGMLNSIVIKLMKYYSCDELNKIPNFIKYVNENTVIVTEYNKKILNN
jgi:hypothetical protein